MTQAATVTPWATAVSLAYNRPSFPLTVTDAIVIARADDRTLHAMGYPNSDDARARAADLLAGEVEKLLGRLNAVIAYVADETDGDCQPHDTHLYDINLLALGKSLR